MLYLDANAIFHLELSNIMKITSPAFSEGAIVPQKYTCQGEDISPPLIISGVPLETKSLVIILDDPDAPNGTFTHWILYNIDPKTTEIDENKIPESAILGKNDADNNRYVGPCPPRGTHRYFFTIYALNDILALQGGEKTEEVYKAMQHHVIEQAQLMGKFAKQ